VAYAFGGIDPEFARNAKNPKHGGTGVEFSHTKQVTSPSQLIPADLLFYNSSTIRLEHVAIYLGDRLTIQAPETFNYVRILPMIDATLGAPAYYRRYNNF
jgi:cell wall-associated NlpC family hydrolase